MPVRDSMNYFEWEVHQTGYDWLKSSAFVDGREQRGEYLADHLPMGQTVEVIRYHPLQTETGLFKAFASLKPNKSAYKEFADRFGRLTSGDWVTGKDGKTVWGESLSVWHRQHADLSVCVGLWEATGRGDTRYLSRFVEWRGTKGVNFTKKHASGYSTDCWIATEHQTELLQRFRPGDLVLPTKYQVRTMVNKALGEFVAPRLLWDRGTLKLFNVPSNLIGAMWLQFARSISGNLNYRQCAYCPNWFEVSASRSDRRFCSDSCKMRSSRASRAKPKEAKS